MNDKLENTILKCAEDRLGELKQLVSVHEEKSDVYYKLAELGGLTDLSMINDSGLSDLAKQKLIKFNEEAMHQMRRLHGTSNEHQR